MSDPLVVRAFDVRVNSFQGSTILVRDRDVYELGEVEELIWSLCDGGHTLTQIASAVAEQFEVDAVTAESDVRGFVEELLHDKLVEPA